MKKRGLLLALSLYLSVSSIAVPLLWSSVEHYFRYFTNLSNFFMGLCALLLSLFLLLHKGEKLPHWLTVLQLAGTASVTLTLVTVLLFLMPQEWAEGKDALWLFQYDMLFFHLLNPLCAILCFTVLEKDGQLCKKEALWGALPCAVYSVIYLIEVAFLKYWPDFYGFTFGGHNGVIPLVVVVMLAASFGLSLLLELFHNRGAEQE